MSTLSRFLQDVEDEVEKAGEKHAPMNSLHGGYAVLLEEFDELWDQVKLKRSERDPENICLELIQIAAMAARTAVDLGFVRSPSPPVEDTLHYRGQPVDPRDSWRDPENWSGTKRLDNPCTP